MTTIGTSQGALEDVDASLAALRDGRLGEALGVGPKELQAGLALAASHLERGSVEEALRLYAALVLCHPSDPELQAGLANCALKAEQYHLAIQASAALIATSPLDPRGYLFSGTACLATGDLREAQEDLSSAAEMARRSGQNAIAHEADRLLGIAAEIATPARAAAGA